MIHSHLIANQPETPVYSQPADSQPASRIPKGSWLGVVERMGEWIRVIGTNFEGWVKNADVKSLPPMKLKVVWSPGKPIEYKMLSNAS
jgi:hypothetical protein